MSSFLNSPAGLAALGFAIGAFGTLIGAGGGFILVPILLLINPAEEPEVITALTLAVVCCNATFGSIAYAFERRIDYRSAFWFAVVSLPGSVLGVYANARTDRKLFNPLFGLSLIGASLYLATRKSKNGNTLALGRPTAQREIVDADGNRYLYAFDMRLGLAVSAAVGFLSSFLGIGGGIIHVPAMVHLLDFPVHLATATSHLVVALMAAFATIQHAFLGSLASAVERLVWLTPGVLFGAPLGARLSRYVHGKWILRLLAGALFLVGLRLVVL